MDAIPRGARVRLSTAARGGVVSPLTGSLVTVPVTLPAGLEGVVYEHWRPRPCTYVLVVFPTPGLWPAHLWIATGYLEEIPAEVVA